MNDLPARPPQLRPVSAVLADLSRMRIAAEPAPMPLDEAVGLVLDRDIVTVAPVPARATALIAGYAVESASLVGVSPYAPCVVAVKPPWVEAGRELPGGCDAVLPADAVVPRARLVEISHGPSPGENVRRIGEDALAGQVLAPGGAVLRPLAAAAVGMAGIDRVSVRAARLGILVEAPFRGIVMRLLTGLDGVILNGREADGDPRPAPDARTNDVILVVGSDRNGFASALPTFQPVASGLALRFAETTMVGISEGRPVVWARPRLDTLLSLRYALFGPWFDSWNGVQKRPVWRRAPLRRKLASAVGLAEVALLCETTGGLEPLGLGSLTLPGIAQAEGFLIVPPDSEGFQAGETVEAFAL